MREFLRALVAARWRQAVATYAISLVAVGLVGWSGAFDNVPIGRVALASVVIGVIVCMLADLFLPPFDRPRR